MEMFSDSRIPVISVMGVPGSSPFPRQFSATRLATRPTMPVTIPIIWEKVMDEWEKLGFAPDGIYTGFLADEKQADKILDFFRRFRSPETMVLVDPVRETAAELMGFTQKTFG